MGAKYLRNITKILKSASGVLYGRSTVGTGRGEELTPSDVRTLLSVYTVTQTDTAISTAVNNLIGGSPGLLDTLDELAAALGDDANFASTVTTALSGKVNTSDLSESIDDRVAALLIAGTNISLTYNDASGTLTVDSTAGGLSGTGSVDNAALRADGTGGSTLQSSAWIIADNYTASPNNTINHASLQATGGTTNVSVSIAPKGTGAFCLQVPDGTATGGNVRGANAVDLQTLRSAASMVASGANSAILGGENNTASGAHSTAWGISAVASGSWSTAGGRLCTASGSQSVAVGNSATASGNEGSVAFGRAPTASGTSAVAIGREVISSGYAALATGMRSRSDRHAMRSHSGGYFATEGDAQQVSHVLSKKTTDATPATMLLGDAASRLTIPSGKIMFANVIVSGIKSDGSAAACYKRKVAIKNVGGTTSLVGSVETIGTDIEDNASTDITITADNTNDALDISVTGIAAETWRWVAVVEGLEIAYGT